MKNLTIKPIVLLTIFLTNCVRIEQSITPFVDDTCPPPCWRNIIPGITKEEDLINILQGAKDVKQESIDVEGLPTTLDLHFRQAQWVFTNNMVGRAGISNDIVSRVSFVWFDGTVYLRDILKIFGDPETIVTIPGGGDSLSYMLEVIIPEKGIVIGIDKRFNLNSEWNIQDNTRAGVITFTRIQSTPDFLADYLGSIKRVVQDPEKLSIEDISQPWPGFDKPLLKPTKY